jgi:DUF971 family protein
MAMTGATMEHDFIRVREIGQLDERTLAVTWNDGRKDAFDVVELRRRCPCAMCIDEWTGEKRLDPKAVKETTRPVQIDSVGSYAMQIRFNDGHGTGIYTFQMLREMAQPH